MMRIWPSLGIVGALLTGCGGDDGGGSGTDDGASATFMFETESATVATTSAGTAITTTGPTTTVGTSVGSVTSVGVTSDVSTGVPEQVFLDDQFDGGLDLWVYQGPAGYTMAHDPADGVPEGSLRISGDAAAGNTAGATKAVDVSGWATPGLALELWYRAQSNFDGSVTTNANVAVFDGDTGAELVSLTPFGGGAFDSGWQVFSIDIADQVIGAQSDSLRIAVFLNDQWAADHEQVLGVDSVRLAGY